MEYGSGKGISDMDNDTISPSGTSHNRNMNELF